MHNAVDMVENGWVSDGDFAVGCDFFFLVELEEDFFLWFFLFNELLLLPEDGSKSLLVEANSCDWNQKICFEINDE